MMGRWIGLALCAVVLTACDDGSVGAPPPSPPPPASYENSDAVMVTGSRIRRESFTATAPLQVVDYEVMGNAGLTDQEQVLNADEPAPIMLAYRYAMMLEMPRDALAETQSAHMQACLDAGPRLCQVINASVSDANSALPRASLSLRAEPDWLAQFRAGLEAEAEAAGGALVSSNTQVEDLTARIVDGEARLQAQTTLRDRLQQLLETRDGDLADLLAVERELATVQADLDARASMLAALRERVNTSILDLSYIAKREIVEPTAFNPISNAMERVGEVFSRSVAEIILFVAAVLPWLVILLPLLWLVVRTLVRAVRGRRKAKAGA